MKKRRHIIVLVKLLFLTYFFRLLLQSFDETPDQLPFNNKSVETSGYWQQAIETLQAIKKPLYNLLQRYSDNYETISPSNESLHISRDDVNASLLCPFPPPNLRGRQKITFNSIPPLAKLKVKNSEAFYRGVYSPPDCLARQRIAIVIPYRNREQNLTAFLYYMHPFLQRQKMEYGIYIIEQNGKLPFNRGILLNIGFVEALKVQLYDCFIFHDVDLIPENDHNFYFCHTQPLHLSVAVNTFEYRLPYSSIFGGATAISTHQFQKINGYSNLFWGWGGEDDDLSWRVTSNGFRIFRYPEEIATYTMIPHKKAEPNPNRKNLLNKKENFAKKDLSTLAYEVKELKRRPFYTWISVNVKK